MIRSVVLGCGAYLPARVMTNDDLAKVVDTSDEWIVERSGIRQRHIAAEGEKTSDLALAAARNALANAGVAASDLDLIVLATATPDETFPATACKVQHDLGMTRGAAFDVQAVCSGFIYALATADNFIKAGQAKRALVIGAETFSRILDWTDRTTCVLFGDGAGAVVLGAEEGQGDAGDRGILSTHLHSDGRHHEALKANGLQQSDIDWLVPHQANKRILDGTARKLGLDPARVVVTVEKHGNTSAASVPLALAEATADGRIKKGQIVLLEAMGGGFTWGSALVRW